MAIGPNPFVDHVRIYLTSGKGGNGVVGWRREKYVPKGGPDGGNGGQGGSIILKGNAQLWTLLDLKYRKYIKAQHGQNGMGALKTGKSGENEILEVPLGTTIINEETGAFIGEVTEDGQELLVLEGGWGGRGNATFKSSTNQAPDYSTEGGPSQEMQVVIELKVLADVGLVGFPNAGKSTFLASVTSAKPKIGDYPFTTLVPNLGIVKYKDYTSFAIADIPGIIDGASEGKGLGHNFLRHIERNAVLLLMVPCDSDNIETEFEVLEKELKAYNEDLSKKKVIKAISKIDILGEELMEEMKSELKNSEQYYFFSAATRKGIDGLLTALYQEVQRQRIADPEQSKTN